MPPRSSSQEGLLGLDGRTYTEPLSKPCRGDDAIKRTAVCALFAFVKTLFPTTASSPHRVESVPLTLKDFTNTETIVKDVFASHAGQYLFTAFMLHCTDADEAEVPPVSEYVRDGKRIDMSADTPLRSRHTYAVLCAPGVPTSDSGKPGERLFDVGAALLSA